MLDYFYKFLGYIYTLAFFLVINVIIFLLGETQFAITFFFGLVSVTTLVFFIRIIYFRERPKEKVYWNFITKLDASSFPSMHSARATLSSFLLITNFDLNIFLTIFLIILTLLVLHSRVYLKKHYFSDVVVGGIVGILVGLVVNYI